ncbi:MAG: SpoIIE family protein phosphatase [Akkermansia sp.]|nr:SpoIIE family protein phosphatase [Akkermansia sp.]
MQRKFLTWLLVLICSAFAVAGLLSFLQFQRQAESRAKALMSNRLYDLMLLIRFTQDNMRHVEQINDRSTLERTRAAARIISQNPAIIKDYELMQGLCNELGATQLCISNEEGTIVAGVPKNVVGFKLGDHEQSRYFLDCINEPGHELVQRPRNSALDGKLLQYAGVTRPDAPGVLQLGFAVQHEQSVREAIGLDTLIEQVMQGASEHVIAFRDGQLLNRGALNLPTSTLLSQPLNSVGEVSTGGVSYATYAIEENGIRLVSFMPWQEISKVSFKSLRYMLLSNMVLFLLMFVIVWWLLRIYVLSGLQRINNGLRRITEGYTEERIEEKSTPEFTRLSTGINAMVDSLQSYADQKREHLMKELHLAAAIQHTVLPSKFPAFPDRTDFDIYASCLQAQTVGGDFYDFFMPDDKHICFLLGDVSGTGIPAALFMMRAISIIRELANTGATPRELVTGTNKILCREGADMKLSLFYGRLNVSTGDLRFVNAGTPQALLCHVSGNYEMLAMHSGAVLGAYSGAAYSECRFHLQPGDRLFLYTQGVINATDSEHTPFGAARLQEALTRETSSVSETIRGIRAALQQFTGNMEQKSDITMLSLEYRGKWTINYHTSFTAGEPAAFEKTLQEKLESVFAAPDSITELQAAVTAILNVFAPDTRVHIQLRCNEQEARLTLTYNQPHFNPLIVLPHLPLDKITFLTSQESSTLKLRKSL